MVFNNLPLRRLLFLRLSPFFKYLFRKKRTEEIRLKPPPLCQPKDITIFFRGCTFFVTEFLQEVPFHGASASSSNHNPSSHWGNNLQFLIGNGIRWSAVWLILWQLFISHKNLKCSNCHWTKINKICLTIESLFCFFFFSWTLYESWVDDSLSWYHPFREIWWKFLIP